MCGSDMRKSVHSMHTANEEKKLKNKKEKKSQKALTVSKRLVLDNFHFLMFVFFLSLSRFCCFAFRNIVCCFYRSICSLPSCFFSLCNFLFAPRSGNKCYYPLLPNILACRFGVRATRLLLLIIFPFVLHFLRLFHSLSPFYFALAHSFVRYTFFFAFVLFIVSFCVDNFSWWRCQTY